MTCNRIVVLLASLTLGACGGKSPSSTSPSGDGSPDLGDGTVPIADGAAPDAGGEHDHTKPDLTKPDPEPVKADPKAALRAAEMAAYEKAKPVFGKWCSKCHTSGGANAKPKTLAHFDMSGYPFGGHHAMEIGGNIRKALGIGGGKPTMPKDRKGAVKGDELALIAAWADAFDASHAGGAHEGAGHGHGAGHDH